MNLNQNNTLHTKKPIQEDNINADCNTKKHPMFGIKEVHFYEYNADCNTKKHPMLGMKEVHFNECM